SNPIMAISSSRSADMPLGDLNTTPLIDVMLVLLVMFILAIPVATNSVPIDLPPPGNHEQLPKILRDSNKVSVTSQSVITFNNQPVTPIQLAKLLRATVQLRPEPELQFQPDQSAPYDATAKVLNVIKTTGVSAFGFVGNEQFQQFSKAPKAPRAVP
ncbi:MAG: biopolymer transporter ExbD, partial [Novosphingobium sp.]|uniref:ExbD/TolR family protein n=1 Tax=Novosphingobium sp. TaxID=1874826 RepID=UPI003C7BC08D